MSTSLTPVPAQVIFDVDAFVSQERDQVEQYENREHMDSSAVYSLHALARQIYALGWADGYGAHLQQRS
jgi:hypothetical protein